MEFVEDLMHGLTIADSSFQRFRLSTYSVLCSQDSRLPRDNPKLIRLI